MVIIGVLVILIFTKWCYALQKRDFATRI